jgi:hypothetical protein
MKKKKNKTKKKDFFFPTEILNRQPPTSQNQIINSKPSNRSEGIQKRQRNNGNSKQKVENNI